MKNVQKNGNANHMYVSFLWNYSCDGCRKLRLRLLECEEEYLQSQQKITTSLNSRAYLALFLFLSFIFELILFWDNLPEVSNLYFSSTGSRK